MFTLDTSQIRMLGKLGIEKLNPMQEEAFEIIRNDHEVVLLSPTGTGKTVACLLPLISDIDPKLAQVQLLIVVPTRELAIQIVQVIGKMGTGLKGNAVYGGRPGAKDKAELRHLPAILTATPGRLADHLSKKSFSVEFVRTVILDEFDKSLEIGFEAEMKEIMTSLPNLKKRILTSATRPARIPEFVGMRRAKEINYLDERAGQLIIKKFVYENESRKDALLSLLNQLSDEKIVVFCSFKDTIRDVSEFLCYAGADHSCFHGDMEQQDREHALIKFRNGTNNILLATDLAARGIDIPEIKYIIHYELPQKKHEFTHRNGRTARMHRAGTAYVIEGVDDNMPDFVGNPEREEFRLPEIPPKPRRKTIHILGGKRDKISKGDIVGLFIKQGKLKKEELGVIELKHDCAYVGVDASAADRVVSLLNNTKLKKKKIRVSVL